MIPDFLAKMRTNRFDPEYLPSFESKLFFEGERKNKQIVNFIVLLALATVIATYGVVTDSTASVIGAMFIAPLMTPIMAAAAAALILVSLAGFQLGRNTFADAAAEQSIVANEAAGDDDAIFLDPEAAVAWRLAQKVSP